MDSSSFLSTIRKSASFIHVQTYAREYRAHIINMVQVEELSDTWQDFDFGQESAQTAFGLTSQISKGQLKRSSSRVSRKNQMRNLRSTWAPHEHADAPKVSASEPSPASPDSSQQ
eukprot:gnl/TRDRNA2_/TRDRNA2_94727_c0_seq1.p1 gnl/TRDRNA2_/TRDRNA2_94727_c0~~gnl/TRDRNA2_/TRDRNA2_94727_c0_seq1.p1  ORF type:complete len:115 (+),score=9.20 gnl/TRDRNA2_/TRDRNA2_94727_c0_seq1:1-345(+)